MQHFPSTYKLGRRTQVQFTAARASELQFSATPCWTDVGYGWFNTANVMAHDYRAF